MGIFPGDAEGFLGSIEIIPCIKMDAVWIISSDKGSIADTDPDRACAVLLCQKRHALFRGISSMKRAAIRRELSFSLLPKIRTSSSSSLGMCSVNISGRSEVPSSRIWSSMDGKEGRDPSSVVESGETSGSSNCRPVRSRRSLPPSDGVCSCVPPSRSDLSPSPEPVRSPAAGSSATRSAPGRSARSPADVR